MRQLQAHNDTLISSYPGGPDAGREAAETDPALGAQLLAHHLSAVRNKRCLLAYHAHRLEWLRARLWERGGSVDLVLEEGTGTPAGPLRLRLSASEIRALKDYADLVRAYKSEFLDILDLSAPLARAGDAGAGGATAGGGAGGSGGSALRNVGPPYELMVTVVARRDARDVMTERGTINLRRGERMRVARAEVEGLIVRGWLAVVDE